MATLKPGQYELDGYVFGTPEDAVTIMQDGLDTGSADVRSQDNDRPGYDGTMFGVDYLNGPMWSFTLGVRDDEDVYGTLSALARVWRNEAIRKTPGKMSTLRFNRKGTTYRVYGRPRQFGVVPAPTEDHEFQIVEAEFKVESPVMFADSTVSSTVRLNETTVPDHVILPETLEWVLGKNSATASVVLNVQSLDPAPFEVRVRAGSAPLSNWKVIAGGRIIESDYVIPAGNNVLIDTRAMTAMHGMNSIAGSLSRDTRLNARLWDGMSLVTFEGTDTSGTASVTVSYRPTLPIL